MSVILRDPRGKIVLYSKGADNILLERMVRDPFKQKETWEHLTEYAGTGLRTLAVASREIPEQFYQTWSQEYLQAKLTLGGDEEDGKDVRKERMMAA